MKWYEEEIVQREDDLEIHDVWESPNGNRFIKVGGGYSLALYSDPNSEDLKYSQFVKSHNTRAKKIGKIIFDKTMKDTIPFEQLGINLPFTIDGSVSDESPVRVKIDESRYIHIGKSGATCLDVEERKTLMVNPV